jgi:AcrR family transcriptional regulator
VKEEFVAVQNSLDIPSRDAVLDAARSLIVDHGYAGWSMRELANKSGLAKATIYHHFTDKKDIYLSVLEREVVLVRDRTIAAANSPGNAVDRLRAVIRTFYDLQAERHVVILSALREMSGSEAQLCSLLRRYRNELLAPIRQLLESGVREKLFRPVNDEMALVTIFGIMHSFVTHRLLIGDAYPAEDIVEHTLQMLLNGIGNHSPAD